MVTESTQTTFAFDLSREEQWVVHHVLLDRIEMELHAPESTDPPSPTVYRAFEKLEGDAARLSQSERECVRDELRRYVDADDTPERDRPVAKRVLWRLDERTADS